MRSQVHDFKVASQFLLNKGHAPARGPLFQLTVGLGICAVSSLSQA